LTLKGSGAYVPAFFDTLFPQGSIALPLIQRLTTGRRQNAHHR
jgi:hypothetical protein